MKNSIREREQRKREMFVPLAHPPGHAQADFGGAVAIIGGDVHAFGFLRGVPLSILHDNDRCLVT